jgi:hypothetical protein
MWSDQILLSCFMQASDSRRVVSASDRRRPRGSLMQTDERQASQLHLDPIDSEVSTAAHRGGTVLTVHRQTCLHCGRTVYECGQARIIEAARTHDGKEPVEEFLRRLEKPRRAKNTQRLADIAIVFEEYGRTGTLDIPRELNDLRRGGLWEIKAGDVRFPFFEFTDKALWVMGEDRSHESI